MPNLSVRKPVVDSSRCSTYALTSQACENLSVCAARTQPRQCHVDVVRKWEEGSCELVLKVVMQEVKV
eukprot:6183437-Amphidinium_carterae.1